MIAPAPQEISLVRHLGFIQLRVIAGDVAANLTSLARMLRQLEPPRHSLIVLPELWATGFAYPQLPALRQEVAALADQLRGLAATYDILLAGSLPEPTPDRYDKFFNTLTIIGRDGLVGSYRKRHLFPGEEEAFRPWSGVFPPVVTPGGSFGCLICYDLRFPELSRLPCQQGADLLLCSAQWPAARRKHWRALMIARAIENQIFMVGCNGVGENGPLTLGGHSLVISPTGEVLYEAGEEETAKIIELDWRLKRQARSGFASFASAPFVTSGAKIVTAEQGLVEAAQRASVGQRVVHAALDRRDSLLRSIELLEKERQAGDYLLVGVNLGSEDNENRLRLLRTYAALGCVDAVFDLGELSPADHERLQEICRRADASPSGSPPAEAAPG